MQVGMSVLFFLIFLSHPRSAAFLIPWPGTEPTAPALEEKVFTTGPPRKSWGENIFNKFSKGTQTVPRLIL